VPFRLEKLNSLMKEELSKIIQREIEFPPGIFVSIVYAKTSSDATHAQIGISVLPEEKENVVLKKLNKEIYRLQHLLNKKLVMQYVPKINFKIDKTAAKIDRFEKLVKEINKCE
jgi:ribosome-binding factor A